MIRCIALDDEPLALELIQEFCKRVDFIELQRTFTQPSEANKYLNKFPVDLIFLDISMPNITGIDFFKNISNDVMVIFSTAFSEYAVEGFNLKAIDYILKPFEFNRFLQAVEKAQIQYNYLHQTNTNNVEHLFVRSDYSLVKIPFSEILFIETLDDYVKIHSIGRKPILTLLTLKAITEKLPATDFFRVHRSYIISIKKIESVRGKTIELGFAQIPISSKYEEAFFKAYTSDFFY